MDAARSSPFDAEGMGIARRSLARHWGRHLHVSTVRHPASQPGAQNPKKGLSPFLDGGSTEWKWPRGRVPDAVLRSSVSQAAEWRPCQRVLAANPGASNVGIRHWRGFGTGR